ncbi:MAG: NAD(P)-dependent oxidoreductase [Chloroflexi bacterium]|nr:NAD(P)-dependent oxidoreductase [Chloroflexota bacterium]
MRIGFIGTGAIGGPMCRHVIRHSDADVMVFDLNPEAVQRCTDVGGVAAASVAEAVEDADVLLTSLPGPRDVEAVALGAEGIEGHARPGTVYFDLTTNSPAVARKVAARLQAGGITMLDAPVSGGVAGAEERTLTVMAGGDAAALEKHRGVLASFGENIIHTGDLGSGCIAKLVNNMIAFCTTAAGAEGLLLGTMAGVDPELLERVVRHSTGDSRAFRGLAKDTLAGDWSPTFALDLAYKDLHLALELADELNVPLSLSPQVHNLMRMARAMGHGGDNATAVMRVYERTMDTEVRARTT